MSSAPWKPETESLVQWAPERCQSAQSAPLCHLQVPPQQENVSCSLRGDSAAEGMDSLLGMLRLLVLRESLIPLLTLKARQRPAAYLA